VATVRELVDDPAERARIAARIAAIGRGLTWERSARATWAVLEAAASARWPRRALVRRVTDVASTVPGRSLLVPAGSRRQVLVRSAIEGVRSAR